MSKKTKHLGQDSGSSSSRWLSPQAPYTGDGKTKRSILDGVINVFRTSGGKPIKAVKPKKGKR